MQFWSSLLNTRLFDIKLGKYRFHPGIFLTVITILVAYILFSLGQWQAGRAEYKENLQQKIAQRQNLPARSLGELPDAVADRVYLPVNMEGRYDTLHQLLLDNRIVNGKVGYDVYTPFVTTQGDALLVNRGFVELGASREQLPDIALAPELVTLTGLLNRPPSKGVILADNLHSSEHWPMVLQYIDTSELSRRLDYRIMDMVLILNAGENGSLTYHLPALNLNSDKNRGYAFQWYAMALTVCLLYLFLNTSRERAAGNGRT